ncbi:Heme NO binding domain protein [Sinomonas atrocyanea]|uniref:Heme NO binding domain protein n=1 Tax=Sinomonas atrocyanea TaxID=37927 RepID=A0A126ZYF1_9MICC|nr:heme NO-binding domain-containing protein [Sinomonas atrocyanea]AMM31906.1 Heme NO binding domain protein [Sinomonas atrocyanea]GEB66074.1 hypothetical protein SAT01_35220 [Sinomonas atrocyanea]GGG76830.1 hypothetical protein GCM10007172_32210 [Sinomonas atrocyanea]
MKGIIFNLLEEAVVERHGADAWDGLLDGLGLDGVYTSLGSYPDAEVYQIVEGAGRLAGLSPAEALRWFGREAMALMAGRFPAYFSAHTTALPFLLSVNSMIHPEVRKIYPGADVPTFGFRTEPSGALLMAYTSPRRLCALAHGFIDGAAAHFGETAQVDHLECMHRGDSECLCRVTFRAAEAA